MSIVPRHGYWLLKSSPNIFKVGINPYIFDNNSHDLKINHFYIDIKLKKNIINDTTYVGSLMNSYLQAIHFSSPEKGILLNINHNLFYSRFTIGNLIDKDKWLYKIKFDQN